MMTKLLKILPMLAIVAGIGGAFGFGAQEDPCNTELVGYASDTQPEGTPEQNDDIRIDGTFGPQGVGTYDCQALPGTCRWVFADDPATPDDPTQVWISCPGQVRVHPTGQ